MCNNLIQIRQKQTGFVLILVLVMLAVLTLIGVSSMERANIELKASANARQHQVAFTATQTLLEYSVSTPVVTGNVINYQDNNPLNFPVSISPDLMTLSLTNASALTTTVSLVGCMIAPGSSLEAGRGLSYSYFSLNGVASNLTGTAASIQGQGVRYPAAGCT